MSLFLHRAGLMSRPPSGAAYLLDTYTGAAAAYSLRVLKASFASSDLILVRRSSDNAELGFTATEITDGTLTTWTGANDGFVVTWYDQSGNGRNATQATAGNQPMIVDAGSLLTANGKPCVTFDGVSDVLTTSASFSMHGSKRFSAFAVGKITTSGDTGVWVSQYLGQNFILVSQGTSRRAYFDGSWRATSVEPTIGTQITRSWLRTADTTLKVYENGSQSGADITVGDVSQGSAVLKLGFYAGSVRDKMEIQEFINYPSDKSSDRASIEANVNTAWGVY